ENVCKVPTEASNVCEVPSAQTSSNPNVCELPDERVLKVPVEPKVDSYVQTASNASSSQKSDPDWVQRTMTSFVGEKAMAEFRAKLVAEAHAKHDEAVKISKLVEHFKQEGANDDEALKLATAIHNFNKPSVVEKAAWGAIVAVGDV
ncbi:MAG TPA: hypothetical protein DF383_01515, partial [Deltaproteobacteria bacterium]|nr:hypothetical protein [Deltaproteobacteria bacterium]